MTIKINDSKTRSMNIRGVIPEETQVEFLKTRRDDGLIQVEMFIDGDLKLSFPSNEFNIKELGSQVPQSCLLIERWSEY